MLNWLLPATCAGCGRRTAQGLCPACCAAIRRPPGVRPPVGLDEWYAAGIYEGPLREAIARLKYRNARATLGLLVALADAALPGDLRVGRVTWVPASEGRRRRGGFDHAALLAEALARARDLPVGALLTRLDRGAQTQRAPRDRHAGPRLSCTEAPPRSVLLVDDVATTGATMRNAAATLHGEGCERVIGVTVARTLLKGALGPPETPQGRAAAQSPHPGSLGKERRSWKSEPPDRVRIRSQLKESP